MADSKHSTRAPSAKPNPIDPDDTAQPGIHPEAQAILDALNSGQLCAPEAWNTLLARLNEVEVIPSDDMPEDEFDQLVDLAGDLALALMSMPAPDSAALIWKLDSIVASGNHYAADNRRQTIEDYRRMLAPVAPDTEIEAAWARRTETLLRYKDLPLIDPPEGEIETPEEAACWVIIDEADEVIRSTVARTPQGAAIQLRVALYNCCDLRDDEDAFITGDLVALEAKSKELGRSAPHMLAALRSLEAQGAACNTVKVPNDHDAPPAAEAGSGASASAMQHEWEIAARLFADTERAQIEFHDSHVAPVMDRYAKGLATIAETQAAERDHEPYRAAHNSALTALTVTPAPTPEALKFKMNTAMCEAFFDGSEVSDRALLSIFNDMFRLLPDGPESPDNQSAACSALNDGEA